MPTAVPVPEVAAPPRPTAEVRLPLVEWWLLGRRLAAGDAFHPPARRVTLTDRDPFFCASRIDFFPDRGRYDYVPRYEGWWWVRAVLPVVEGLSPPHCLPDELIDLLEGHEARRSGGRGYPTAEAARDALSAACLAWARAPRPAPER
jgi:hypothetical protein